jgi:hypothetical protein
MTGHHLDIPLWNDLVAKRDHENPLVEAAHCFYEICRFRNPEANTQRLEKLARTSNGAAREVFEAAGLGVPR